MFKRKKAKKKKVFAKTPALFNMLVGMNIDRAGTRVEENSTISFSTVERVEDKDGKVTYVEVK